MLLTRRGERMVGHIHQVHLTRLVKKPKYYMNKNVLRWVLFFPVGLLCSIVTLLISGSLFRLVLLNFFDGPIWKDSEFWATTERFFSHFAAAFVFVWSGSVCAPEKRFKVSVVMSSINIVFMLAGEYILGLLYKLPENIEVTPNYLLKAAGIGGSLLAIYVIKNHVARFSEG